MRYLLDVNALVALGVLHHEFHARVITWLQTQTFPAAGTCAITEIGFVRVVSQVPAYGFTVSQAPMALLRLKKADALALAFLEDGLDISHLPDWVKSPRQTTDGHLAELASAHGAQLATLDENIPGAYFIR